MRSSKAPDQGLTLPLDVETADAYELVALAVGAPLDKLGGVGAHLEQVRDGGGLQNRSPRPKPR